jgi:hypothetical protein
MIIITIITTSVTIVVATVTIMALLSILQMPNNSLGIWLKDFVLQLKEQQNCSLGLCVGRPTAFCIRSQR